MHSIFSLLGFFLFSKRNSYCFIFLVQMLKFPINCFLSWASFKCRFFYFFDSPIFAKQIGIEVPTGRDSAISRKI